MSEENKCTLTDNFKYQKLFIEGNMYLVGVRKINDVRQVLLTNLVEFYEESLSEEEINRRCEDLNPVLVDFNLGEIIDDLLLNIPKHVTSCTLNCIELESKIEGGRFWFHINLTKNISAEFYDNFVECLCISFSELYNRYNFLLNLVKRKDQEIAQYKLQGIELLRKSLITEPFDEKLFQTKLQNTGSIDKINLFLETINFLNSVKDSQLTSTNIERESRILETELITHDDHSKTKSVTIEKSLKRPSSSDIRCATITKIEKKLKVVKKHHEFKYL